MRIVFLGDSLTWGQYGGDFVAEVAKELPDYEIINAGVGGDTIVNLLRRLEDDVLAHDPDAVFVMVGGNDAKSHLYPATGPYYRKSKALENGVVTPDDFETSYRELLYQLQTNYILPLVGLAPTEYNQEVIEAQHEYNALAREVAESLNVPILDLDTIFTPENPIEREAVSLQFIQEIGKNWSSGWDKFEEERKKWGYTYTFDGLHILPETAPKFAEYIVPFLRENL
jgi:lysophospholipase L1-like esterase